MEALESRALFSAASADFVILVSVDGLRPDAVTTLGPSQAPNFYRLRTEGAFTDNARTDHDYTVTLPNHTTQVTGRPVVGGIGHNWTTNGDPLAGQTLHSNKGSYVASAFDVAHDHGLRTGLYASKTKFSLYDTSYDAETAALQGGAPDAYLTDGDQGRDKLDAYVYRSDTAAMTDAFAAGMKGANPFDFAMVHYHDPDTAGHASGWMGTAYMDAVRRVDEQIGKILTAIEATPALAGRTALMVTSDHGGEGTGHGNQTDPEMYTIPFYVWGAGATAGADLYALNGSTRTNPGGGRIDNAARPQPIRNGDAANLAMDYLDLPAVPGSLLNSGLDLSVAPAPLPGPAAATVVSPQDNGASDFDPATGTVRVSAEQGSFAVRLTDADGVDDASVVPSVLRMTRDGVAVTDYVFSYDPGNDTVTLTPGGGASTFTYGTYELHLNDTFARVRDGAGNALSATRLRVLLDPSAGATSASFQQGVDGYAGARDTLVHENNPTTSYATATVLKVDGDDPAGTFRDVQSLVRFDNVFGSGPGQVPAGAEIRTARLELEITNAGNALRLHRMLTAWSDAATWNSLGTGVQADGVEAAPVEDPTTVTTAFANAGPLSVDVTESLRAWQADPSRNFGWAIVPTGDDGVQFYSAEGTTRPRLVVEFALGAPPVARADEYEAVEDTRLVVAAPGVLSNDSDADGDALTAALVDGPAHGDVVLAPDGSFTYEPDPDYFGTDTFTYRAGDGRSFSPAVAVTLSVGGTPDAAVAVGDAYAVGEDAILTVAPEGGGSKTTTTPTTTTPTTCTTSRRRWWTGRSTGRSTCAPTARSSTRRTRTTTARTASPTAPTTGRPTGRA